MRKENAKIQNNILSLILLGKKEKKRSRTVCLFLKNFKILSNKLLNMQIIALSASANKLSKIQDRAEEYAALIMEELDPNNLGYIEVCLFST